MSPPYARNKRRQLEAGVIAAANTCFSESGWSGTTLAQIAERAGVTPQAVHLSVGSKPALLMAALGQAIAGGADGRPDADRPSFERALFRDALQADATDAERVSAFAAATAAIHESAGPLFEVLAQAEQTDPDLRRRRTEIEGTQARTGTRDGSGLGTAGCRVRSAR